MKIVSLQSENVKRLKAIEITPDGNVVTIGGKNAAGKTSVIDSIVMALGGMDHIPERPIRDGETEAKIVLDLGDYVVQRHWTAADKSYLSVKTKDGATYNGPQKMLDGLVGELSFDPLAFALMDSKKRLATLKDLTKLDFSALEKQIADAAEARKELKKDGDKLKARMETEFKDLVEVQAVPDIEQIKEAKAEAEKINEGIRQAKTEYDASERLHNEMDQALAQTLQQIFDLEAKKASLLAKIKHNNIVRENLAMAAKQELEDVAKYDDAVTAHWTYQQYLDKVRVKTSVETELETARKAWFAHDEIIKKAEAKKIEMVTNAKMPIAGLSFGDGEVLFNNIPFLQLSQAEQIKVSMAIAIAMNPKLKLALIYNGSLLDSETLKHIAAIAEKENVQVWIERVMDAPDGNCFYIEEGEVRQAEQPAIKSIKQPRARKTKATEVRDGLQ